MLNYEIYAMGKMQSIGLYCVSCCYADAGAVRCFVRSARLGPAQLLTRGDIRHAQGSGDPPNKTRGASQEPRADRQTDTAAVLGPIFRQIKL